MFLVVHSIQRPKGFEGPTCRQQDLISTRMYGHELCDVVDATFVGDPDTILKSAVTGDLILGEDGKSWAFLYGPLGLLGLHKRRQRRAGICEPWYDHIRRERWETRIFWKTACLKKKKSQISGLKTNSSG